MVVGYTENVHCSFFLLSSSSTTMRNTGSNSNIPAALAPESNGSGSVNSNNNNNNNNNKKDAKQRRREKRAAKSESTSNNSGQITRRKQEENASSKRGGAGGGSVLWTILMLGLVFCLVDVLYIMKFVDRQSNIMPPVKPMPSLVKQPTPTPVVDTKQVLVDSSSSKAKPIPPPPLIHKITNENPVVVPKIRDLGQIKHRIKDHIVGVPPADLNGNKNKPVDKPVDKPKPVDPLELTAKARILELMKHAGVNVDVERDADLIRELPTWNQVTDLYGEEPVIYGLDTCQVFQDHSDKAEHFVSTAGAFNSGTNLMAELLIANCHMQDRMDKYGTINKGVRWQVPWGKHTPPGDEAFRQAHKTTHDANVEASNILPAVTIRDPLFWLHSMCKHHYTARWMPSLDGHCPDFSHHQNLKATVTYSDFKREHESILHHWNDYYNEYVNADFPRLLVRYEDLLFHPKELTKTVCECAGGSMKRNGTFKYIVDSAKKGAGAHGAEGTRTGYVDAIIKYGSEEKRYSKYVAKQDLEYIRDHVDANLMSLLKYPPADPDKLHKK